MNRIDRVAFILTGHICGQCNCSNEAGWKRKENPCACRIAAQEIIDELDGNER